MKYDAFISYSHQADHSLGKNLQKALQLFGKPWYKKRALNVFRDKTNLSADPHLWSNIKHALSESEYFILFASPESAQSKWVRREVQFWIENKSINNLILILTKGILMWDQQLNQFDWKRTTAVSKISELPFLEEPLYIDFTGLKSEAEQSLSNPSFKEKIVLIIATIRKMDVADIIGAEVIQHRKVVRLRNAAITTLIILLTSVSGIAYYAYLQNAEVKAKAKELENTNEVLAHQVNQTSLQRDTAEEEKKLNLYSFKLLQLEKEDPTKAFRYAQYLDQESGNRTGNFREIINGLYKGNNNFYSQSYTAPANATSLEISNISGDMLISDQNGNITLLSPEGKIVRKFKLTTDSTVYSAFIGKYFVAGDTKKINLYNNKGAYIKTIYKAKGDNEIMDLQKKTNDHLQIGVYKEEYSTDLYKLTKSLQLEKITDLPNDTTGFTNFFHSDISLTHGLIIKGMDQIGRCHLWVKTSLDNKEPGFDFVVLEPQKNHYLDYQGEFEGGLNVLDVSIAPGGYLVMASMTDRTTRIWNVQGEEQGVIYGNYSKIKFLNDDNVIGLDEDGKAYLFNISGMKISEFLGSGKLKDFEIINGKLYTLSNDKIHLWEVFNNKLLDIDVKNKGFISISNIIYDSRSKNLSVVCPIRFMESSPMDYTSFTALKSEFNFPIEKKHVKTTGTPQYEFFKIKTLLSSTGIYRLRINKSGSLDLLDSTGIALLNFQGRTGMVGSVGFFGNDHYFYFSGESGSLEVYYTPIGMLNSKKIARFDRRALF